MESVSRDEHLRVGALACALVRTRSAQALKVRYMGYLSYPNIIRIQSPLARLSILITDSRGNVTLYPSMGYTFLPTLQKNKEFYLWQH